jgi:hypothetical protein
VFRRRTGHESLLIPAPNGKQSTPRYVLRGSLYSRGAATCREQLAIPICTNCLIEMRRVRSTLVAPEPIALSIISCVRCDRVAETATMQPTCSATCRPLILMSPSKPSDSALAVYKSTPSPT